jgi:hypothetical protein
LGYSQLQKSRNLGSEPRLDWPGGEALGLGLPTGVRVPLGAEFPIPTQKNPLRCARWCGCIQAMVYPRRPVIDLLAINTAFGHEPGFGGVFWAGVIDPFFYLKAVGAVLPHRSSSFFKKSRNLASWPYQGMSSSTPYLMLHAEHKL